MRLLSSTLKTKTNLSLALFFVFYFVIEIHNSSMKKLFFHNERKKRFSSSSLANFYSHVRSRRRHARQVARGPREDRRQGVGERENERRKEREKQGVGAAAATRRRRRLGVLFCDKNEQKSSVFSPRFVSTSLFVSILRLK